MRQVSLKDHLALFTDMDHVVLRIGNVDVFMTYASARNIGQGMRVGSRRAAAVSHEKESWTTMQVDDNIEIRDYATTIARKQIKQKIEWRIWRDSEALHLLLNKELEVALHFNDAIKLAASLMDAAKICKLWAGDSSSGFHALAMLTDAEENYKLGL